MYSRETSVTKILFNGMLGRNHMAPDDYFRCIRRAGQEGRKEGRTESGQSGPFKLGLLRLSGPFISISYKELQQSRTLIKRAGCESLVLYRVCTLHWGGQE